MRQEDTLYKALCDAARHFSEVGCDNSMVEEIPASSTEVARELAKWHDNRIILKEIFSFVWKKVVSNTEEVLGREKDPRDALSRVFADSFKIFLIDEPVLGRCIILESHRYEKAKISACFLIPEVTQFLALIRGFIQKHERVGNLLSLNPDALLELLLSIVDGMMFVWVIQDDFGYSSKFTQQDYETISRMLVSSLLISSVDESKQYYDAVAPSYDDLYEDGISTAENQFIGDLLHDSLKGSQAILDLGCGSGLGYELISQKRDDFFKYTGVDISSEMINQAKQKHLQSENAQFHVMDMADLSFFKREEFDAVISLFGSFSHVLDYNKAVIEIERVLKPGGQVMIMVYSRYSLRNLLKTLSTFSIKRVDEMQPYEIRNSTGLIFAEARFYTKRSALHTFRNLSKIRVRGLNATLELPLFRVPFHSSHHWQRAKKYLERETRIFSEYPNCCHSLIIFGEKKA